MGNNIRIGIFQQDIIWQDILENQKKIEQLLNNLVSKPEILVLPEMFSTGFVHSPTDIPLTLLSQQLSWQCGLSKKFKVAIFGSVIEFDNEEYFNRLYFTLPDGNYNFYNKRHLFSIGGENRAFSAGENRLVFRFDAVTIMPQICYDLRFPVWSRNNLNYHLLIYSANWPASRSDIWDTLLKARAIENQSFVIGVNRVGTDGNAIDYNGRSAVYGPKGETILFCDNKEQYNEITLSIDDLLEFRKVFPVLNDADLFEIKTRNQ